jgi:hypothetical protein
MSTIVETSLRIPASRTLSRHDMFLVGMLAVTLVAIAGCAVLAAMYPIEIDAATIQWPTP